MTWRMVCRMKVDKSPKADRLPGREKPITTMNSTYQCNKLRQKQREKTAEAKKIVSQVASRSKQAGRRKAQGKKLAIMWTFYLVMPIA